MCSFQWAFASTAELYSYVSVLNNNLSEINIPECPFECAPNCNDIQHHSLIYLYNSDISNCVKRAIECAIPKRRVKLN